MREPTLERRYRRLLWAYPRHYRARHGAEIVTTLLDLAEAGQARPGAGQTLHLVLCGLRQRFRLPARRPLPVVAAVLAAVISGAFGSVAGTWLGWQAAAPVPSDRELRALNAAATGMPAPAALYSEISAMKGPDAVVRADGTSDYSAERIRAALSSAGWHVASFQQESGATRVSSDEKVIPDVAIPTMLVSFTATKGALKLSGSGEVITGGGDRGLAGRAMYRMDVWPREPLVVRPLTVAGLVAGALVGWLLAAAGAYRVRGSGRRRRWAATMLFTAGLAAAAVPAYQHYRDAYQVMVYAHGSPVPYIVDGPDDSRLPLVCTVVGLLAFLAARAAARPRRTPESGTRRVARSPVAEPN